MRGTPKFSEALRAAIEAGVSDLRVCMPGRIESYDAATQRANVQPLIRRGYLDEARERQIERMPVASNVPVQFCGGGGSRLTFPLQRGDIVTLIVSDFSLDKWLRIGGEVDPDDDRRHNLSDAIALVGLGDPANVLPASADATVLEGDDVRLGTQGASDPVALKSDLQTIYDSIMAATTLSASDFKTSLLAALDAAGFPVAAQKVKAE